MFILVHYQPSTLAPNDSCISIFMELRLKMSRRNWKAQRLQVCISILRELRAEDVSEELRRTQAKNWYYYYEEELRCFWHHALEFMNNLLKNINFCISILRELRAKYVSEKSIRTEAKLLLLLLGGAPLLGKPSAKKSAVFLNIVQKAFDPPPFIWTFVLFCRGCFLKRVFEH